jgi:hypothetical protein
MKALLAILCFWCVALSAQPLPVVPTVPVAPPNIRVHHTVTLAWDAVAGAQGYKVYQGVASRTYTNVVDAGTNTVCTLTNLPRGENYFAATAYISDAAGTGESDYSSELLVTLPIARSNFVFTLTMQTSANAAGPFMTLSNMPALNLTNPRAPMQFFRLLATRTNY